MAQAGPPEPASPMGKHRSRVLAPEFLNDHPTPIEELADKARLAAIKQHRIFITDQEHAAVAWKGVDDADSMFTKENHQKLKALIRVGIPEKYRVKIWTTCAGSRNLMKEVKTLYLTALRSAYGTRVPTQFFQVPTFGGILRTDVHPLSPAGVESVQRLLSVLRIQNAEIDFCPMLPDIACLLMTYLDEKTAFYTLQSMMDRSRNEANWFFCMTVHSHASFLSTFQELVERNLSDLYAHMLKIDLAMELISEDWLAHFFVHALPYSTILALFDAYMNEGMKIIYRAGLALLRRFKAQLMKTNDMVTFLDMLRNLTRNLTDDTGTLMKGGYTVQLSRTSYGRIHDRHKQMHRERMAAVTLAKTMYFRPRINEASDIIDDVEFEMIWGWLPTHLRVYDAARVFSSETHGYALSSLFNKCRAAGPCITLVETTSGKRFGCFTSHPWSKLVVEKFFGTRECFVFTLEPPMEYKWHPPQDPQDHDLMQDAFIMCSADFVSLGGGDEGPALWIDGALNHGMSFHSKTFQNPSLAGDEKTFTLKTLEVYTLCDSTLDLSASAS